MKSMGLFQELGEKREEKGECLEEGWSCRRDLNLLADY